MTMTETLARMGEGHYDQLACAALADSLEEDGQWEEAELIRRATDLFIEEWATKKGPRLDVMLAFRRGEAAETPREREVLARVTDAIGRAYWRARKAEEAMRAAPQ